MRAEWSAAVPAVERFGVRIGAGRVRRGRPNHFCIAHMMVDGTPRVAFTGKTFPFPEPAADENPGGYTDQWARQHLARMAERCGAYPAELGVITPTPTS
jgi:hypothetical protein